MMIILPRIQRPTLLSNNILLLNMMMMVMIMMRITLDILTKVCHQLVMMKILQLPFCGQSYPIQYMIWLGCCQLLIITSDFTAKNVS